MVYLSQPKRCELLGNYIVEQSATVRDAARHFGISKSTVHKDVTQSLKIKNRRLYAEVQALLQKNKQERHLRGGEATRIKYSEKAKEQPSAWASVPKIQSKTKDLVKLRIRDQLACGAFIIPQVKIPSGVQAIDRSSKQYRALFLDQIVDQATRLRLCQGIQSKLIDGIRDPKDLFHSFGWIQDRILLTSGKKQLAFALVQQISHSDLTSAVELT